MHEGRLVAGKYRIERLVAKGSMGEVYEACHVGIGRRVALKRMAPGPIGSSLERIARFRREARAAGAIESDYVVAVFDAGYDDKLGLYLVTEYLVGEDLEVRLGREQVIDPVITAAIGYQVARGLARAHAAGVIHRDLKPGNIFVAERDDGVRVAKILDFGVSKSALQASGRACASVQDDDETYSTAVGVTLGTPDYMSPEQAMGLPDLDGRSDVWALGVTLYEALCGHPPHVSSSSPVDKMLSVVHEDAPPLSTVAPWVPPALRAAIHAALVRDRERRIPDAATFARELERAMPDARWCLSGVHPISARASARASGPPLSSPPEGDAIFDRDWAFEEEEPPSASGNRVQFFRRDEVATPAPARAGQGR